MIITRTAFRIPLAGGGTDLDFYYKNNGGKLISSTFNQFVFVLLAERPIDDKILIQTTTTQFSNNINKVKHEIIREVLKYFKIKKKIQISTFSTLPTSSGLGSSSALIVGLIKAISIFKRQRISKNKIAKIAFLIERKILKYTGGWQDQIIASYGGVQEIKINKNGNFNSQPIEIKKNIIDYLEKKFLLVFTRELRNSSKVISSQKINLKNTIKVYDSIKSLVPKMKKSLQNGDYQKIGEIFHHHWQLKKKLSKEISNTKIDKMYLDLLKDNSFIGGKLIGAGGGGFFLMVSSNLKKSILYLRKKKLNYTKFKFTFGGTQIESSY
tara:strand:- start:873 stop:1847 length:975 start_codon:yes stop_codon:yes gene_type:complete